MENTKNNILKGFNEIKFLDLDSAITSKIEMYRINEKIDGLKLEIKELNNLLNDEVKIQDDFLYYERMLGILAKGLECCSDEISVYNHPSCKESLHSLRDTTQKEVGLIKSKINEIKNIWKKYITRRKEEGCSWNNLKKEMKFLFSEIIKQKPSLLEMMCSYYLSEYTCFYRSVKEIFDVNLPRYNHEMKGFSFLAIDRNLFTIYRLKLEEDYIPEIKQTKSLKMSIVSCASENYASKNKDSIPSITKDIAERRYERYNSSSTYQIKKEKIKLLDSTFLFVKDKSNFSLIAYEIVEHLISKSEKHNKYLNNL
jgi:hypothetical protein